MQLKLEINWYGFFGANIDTDISANNQCVQKFYILFSASLSKIECILWLSFFKKLQKSRYTG